VHGWLKFIWFLKCHGCVRLGCYRSLVLVWFPCATPSLIFVLLCGFSSLLGLDMSCACLGCWHISCVWWSRACFQSWLLVDFLVGTKLLSWLVRISLPRVVPPSYELLLVGCMLCVGLCDLWYTGTDRYQWGEGHASVPFALFYPELSGVAIK
jgi:hypothetical protein